MESIKILLYLL